MTNILCLVYFAKDVEDWFGYGKLNVLLSYKFNINVNNRWTTITTSDINNIEYFTQDKLKDISNICIPDFHRIYEYIQNYWLCLWDELSRQEHVPHSTAEFAAAWLSG